MEIIKVKPRTYNSYVLGSSFMSLDKNCLYGILITVRSLSFADTKCISCMIINSGQKDVEVFCVALVTYKLTII